MTKKIVLPLIIVTVVAAILVSIFFSGKMFYDMWQDRNDQTYATCNNLDNIVNDQLVSLFETSSLDGVTYSCGAFKGPFPVKTWTINYYIRGELEPQKRASDLEGDIAAKVLTAGWKKDDDLQLDNRYVSENGRIALRIEILSARYNMYKMVVSTTHKTESTTSSTSLPVDKPWSRDNLIKYSPFDFPQLSYAPIDSSWSELRHVAGEQYVADLMINEKVDPSISLSPLTTQIDDGSIIGTGVHDNAIYLTNEASGDYKTTINQVVYTLRNLRNLHNTSQFSNDEAISILNGVVLP